MKFNTALLHQNFDGEKSTGSTIMPIYQVSAFAHETAEKLEKYFTIKHPDLLIPELVIQPWMLLKKELPQWSTALEQ